MRFAPALRLFELELLVLDELLAPVVRLLLELLRLTLPLELPLVPLLLELELFGRLTPLLPVRPFEELLLVPPGRLLLLGRLTVPLLEGVLPLPELSLLGLTELLLFGAGGLLLPPLWLLPELMLPPLAFGLTVALGAGSPPSLW